MKILLLFLFVFNNCYASESKKIEATEKAVLAGGCFWCMEPPFEKLPGVKSVISGYTGGSIADPTYVRVSAGETGHAEAVEIVFEPNKISYSEILEVFWRQINPTTLNQQFVDVGSQYRSAIFPQNPAQKKAAEASKDKLIQSGKFSNIVTTIEENGGKFYPAEEYHQDYYKKNPLKYKFYRYNSGRDQYLDKIWGKDRK